MCYITEDIMCYITEHNVLYNITYHDIPCVI